MINKERRHAFLPTLVNFASFLSFRGLSNGMMDRGVFWFYIFDRGEEEQRLIYYLTGLRKRWQENEKGI